MSLSSRRMIFPDRVFGTSATNRMSSGRAMEPIFFTTCSLSSATSAGLAALPFLEDHEGRNCLTLHVVETSDDRGLRDFRMIHERALDLHRADAMAGHVDDVVYASEHPEVAVFVPLGPIAREVRGAIPLAPVPASRSAPDRHICRAASPARGVSARAARRRHSRRRLTANGFQL